MKLLWRRSAQRASGQSPKDLVIFYSSDIHGSDVCWAKFVNAARIYGAGVLIMGGDLTGKAVVPLVRIGQGRYRLDYMGRHEVVTEDALAATEKAIRFNGLYPYMCDPDELKELKDEGHLNGVFQKVITEQLRRWLHLARERLTPTGVVLYVMPGNDDELFVDDVLAEADWVVNPDGRVVQVGGYQMLSCSWVPTTPWHTPRECSEEELVTMLGTIEADLDPARPTILNLHSPPYRTGLDDAPQLNEDLSVSRVAGQPRMVPVGSRAVREIIERVQPLVALHGHIHESRGIAKLGRTKCVNPGSSYGDGTLDGCLVTLADGRLRSVQLIRG